MTFEMFTMYCSMLGTDEDRALFSELYEKYNAAMLKAAGRILPNQTMAEDAVQTAWRNLIVAFKTVKRIYAGQDLVPEDEVDFADGNESEEEADSEDELDLEDELDFENELEFGEENERDEEPDFNEEIDYGDKIYEKDKNISKPRDNLAGYIVITVKHCAYDIINKESKLFTITEEFPDRNSADDMERIGDPTLADVIEAIRTLPENYIPVMELSCVLQFSNGEIAQRLKMNESTVATKISRGKDLLKEKLKGAYTGG